MRFVPLATVLAVSVLLQVSAPATASANGTNSHLWITLEARDRLPGGELKQLLSRPELQAALQNGACFPDGGYVLSDAYGEMAHWEPFYLAYMDWIRTHFEKPYAANPEAALHVAFLMGMASHGLADQVYDSLFMNVARVKDAAGWSSELLKDFDTATDTFFVAATGINVEFEPWAPSSVLSDVYLGAFGYSVTPNTLDNAQRALAVVRAYPRAAAQNAARLAEYRAAYPWTDAHMMDARVPGGPITEAALVSAYLQVMWDRLNGAPSPEDLIIGTTPSHRAGGQPTDHTRVESQVGVVFGHAIDDTSLSADSVTVTDATGRRYAVDLSMWRTQSNVLRLRPRADWPANKLLTVTLRPGLRTIDGMTLTVAQSFDFSTAAATASAPLPGHLDPTPNDQHP